jgi:hypothetical protein
MVVALPCGKLQLLRELGAKTPAAHPAALRRVARPAATLVIMLAAAAAALAVMAQGAARAPRDLLVSSQLERIRPTAGGDAEDTAQDAIDAAAPADELIVSVRFANSSDHVLDAIRITSPIPADLSYVADSASGPGADVLYSVDGGRSFGRPEELAMQAPDGSVRGAEPADYTHVRWVLRTSLDAGASGVARFRAVPR